jgi:vacuolar-type H+-ATPase subunit F/Vma7
MIALGSLALIRGFRLIGFEGIPNPDHEMVRRLIETMKSEQQRAFLVVEQYLADELRDVFIPIQEEGGDILMVELPSIHEPGNLDSYLSTKIETKFPTPAMTQEQQ